MAAQQVGFSSEPQRYTELFQYLDTSVQELNLFSIEIAGHSERKHLGSSRESLKKLATFAAEHFHQAGEWKLAALCGKMEAFPIGDTEVEEIVRSLRTLKDGLKQKIITKANYTHLVAENKALKQRIESLKDEVEEYLLGGWIPDTNSETGSKKNE
jgi:hypothetical protein